MPNGWEWAILVLIALLLLGGARLSGISREVGRDGSDFADARAESGELTAPHSPPSPSPAPESSESAGQPGSVTSDEGTAPQPSPPAPAEND